MNYFMMISVACLCGFIIGHERQKYDKGIGHRSSILVILSIVVFMIINEKLSLKYGIRIDAARIPSYCIMSVSFIGSGLIIYKHSSFNGITSATTLLALVAIGMLIGMYEYVLSIVTTIIVYGVLTSKKKHTEEDKE